MKTYDLAIDHVANKFCEHAKIIQSLNNSINESDIMNKWDDNY